MTSGRAGARSIVTIGRLDGTDATFDSPSLFGESPMSNTLRGLAALCALLLPVASQAEVFINEVHYDDATAAGDTGERIEVVATAGESLAGYRVYLYNGSTPSAATSYDNDLVPTGSLVACGGTVRIATLSYPSNGIQNGANDAFALVN